MDNTTALQHMVRIGKVTALDAGNLKARCIFPETGVTSGLLSVLQHPAMGVAVKADGQHTHTITDTYMGGGSASTEGEHDHEGTVTTTWMPKVNDFVLVCYLPFFNSDGYILGVIP
ncbi:hypothetical protein RFF05_06835 [Bengtsoniella intestinalis]|uniref:hypothetical protein n=1 Tax=Bengtsoniella intestinalis TaxID=3073143 RepID=UPI00391FC39B